MKREILREYHNLPALESSIQQTAKHAYLVTFDENIILGSQTSNATGPTSLSTPPLLASASALRLRLRAAATFASPKS